MKIGMVGLGRMGGNMAERIRAHGHDVVVDGGNSNFRDSMRRGEALKQKGIGFIDAGVSGGIWGLENGYCLMVGGSKDDVARVQPVFDALAPPGGLLHTGPA